MRFLDISSDTATHYRLEQKEHVVFFMLNRFGSIAFELAVPGAKATILSLVIGNKNEQALSIEQRHAAPQTASRLIGKSVLGGDIRFRSFGRISIAENARRSDASQEYRTLLLSANARATVEPTLEIKTDDVRATHAATTSPLNDQALFFAATRGLDAQPARRLLMQGFLNDLFQRVSLPEQAMAPIRDRSLAALQPLLITPKV